jgi:ubiquinone biosynthesis protein
VAAASIAQVHLAVASDGRETAVKVLRPGIEQAFQRDLNLLYWLAALALRRQPSLQRLKLIQVVDIFANTTRLEMDLRMEGAAASELAENFRDDVTFNVPAVDWQRTSQRVLTLERIHGVPVDEVDRIRAAGFDPDDILAQASAAFFNQVFRDGFFHADLHPGNLFVNKEGHIAVVDFGIMGRLDRATRTYIADMLIGFLNGDYRRVARVHFDAGYVPAHQSIETFTQACRAIGEPVQNKPLHEISIGRLLAQLFAVTEQFEMETQPQLLLLQKSMLTAEGVGRILNPSVNMWELARRLIEDWMLENRGMEAAVADELAAAARALRRFPEVVRKIDDMAERVVEGGLKLHPEALGAIVEGQTKRMRELVWSLWLAIAALSVAVIILLLR